MDRNRPTFGPTRAAVGLALGKYPISVEQADYVAILEDALIRTIRVLDRRGSSATLIGDEQIRPSSPHKLAKYRENPSRSQGLSVSSKGSVRHTPRACASLAILYTIFGCLRHTCRKIFQQHNRYR